MTADQTPETTPEAPFIVYSDWYNAPQRNHKEIGYIYYLYHDNILIYIGQTTNLQGRIGAHSTNKHFTRYRYEEVFLSDLTAVERKRIEYFKPILNIQYKPRGGDLYQIIGDYIHIEDKGSYLLNGVNKSPLSYTHYDPSTNTFDIVTRDYSKLYTWLQYKLDTMKSEFIHGEWGQQYQIGRLRLKTYNRKEATFCKPDQPDNLHRINLLTVKDSVVIPFGKHRMKSLAEIKKIDPNYVEWALENLDFSTFMSKTDYYRKNGKKPIIKDETIRVNMPSRGYHN
ncbi:GIY-YIG catalytic domain-containing protein [Spirosoma oryzae]|uniref:GIY-YIG catalytic domain-containing protein n=1 Tax=Spirosoma oryzae TaxID=1469603 RepID=A0A2T0SYB9_9BACT|nr:GIY-YIG nuclease family protein [Spirosoma oryzae]PRY38404.1 GIY-YIG catalytic domain-containing protein [Spirosoma oryzae]